MTEHFSLLTRFVLPTPRSERPGGRLLPALVCSLVAGFLLSSLGPVAAADGTEFPVIRDDLSQGPHAG